MCDTQVSGCQLAAAVVPAAQANPGRLRPARTCAFSVTYSGSSMSAKPLRRAGAKVAATSTKSTAAAAASRRDSTAGVYTAGMDAPRSPMV